MGLEINKYLKSNATLGTILSSSEDLVRQYQLLTGVDLSSNLKKANYTSTITSRATQLFLWGLSGKIINPIAMEDAFLPGRYGKGDAVLNPSGNEDDNNMIPYNTIIEDVIVIKDIDNVVNEGIKKPLSNGQYIYIKFKNGTDWNLLKLKATIGHQNLVDKFSNSWSSLTSFGRSQDNYIYSKTERTFPLSLYEYATSKDELKVMYAKINKLAQLNYGKFSNSNGVPESLEAGTVIKLTIGNLIYDMPAIIQNMEFEFDANAWDIDEFVPTIVKISMDLTFLFEENPTQDTVFYSLDGVERNRLNAPLSKIQAENDRNDYRTQYA